MEKGIRKKVSDLFFPLEKINQIPFSNWLVGKKIAWIFQQTAEEDKEDIG